MATIYQNGIQYSGSGEPLIYDDMGGATSTTGGVHGLVPAPSAGDNEKFLSGDGSWKSAGEYITKTADGNPIEITDGANAPLVKCVTQITGSQDLHGYDKPWVGGAGKNKLENNLTSQTLNYVAYTINDDGSILANGTASPTSNLVFYENTTPESIGLANGTYIISGCPSGGGSQKYGFRVTLYDSDNNQTRATDYGSGATFTIDENVALIRINIFVVEGTSINDTFYPMLCLATETDPTFTPYSNICPITAYTEGEIVGRGKNICSPDYAITNRNGVTYVENADGTVTLTGTVTGGDYYCYIKVGTNPINLTIGETYTFTIWKDGVKGTGQLFGYVRLDKGSTAGQRILLTNGSATVTIEEGTTLINFYMNAGTGAVATGTYSFQIEKGSVSTDYEPYTSTTHTTTFPSEIYRGNEDCVNNKVTSEWIVVDMSTWTNWSTVTYDGKTIVRRALTDIKVSGHTEDFICSHLSRRDDGASTFINGTMRNFASNYYNLEIFVDGVTSEAEMNAWTLAQKNNGTPVLFAYRLATPTTETITPTNLPIKSLNGYTHIESSTGDMDIEYIVGKYQPLVDLIQSSSSSGGGVTQTILYTATAMTDTEINVDLTAYDEYIIYANDTLPSAQIPQGNSFPKSVFQHVLSMSNPNIMLYGYSTAYCSYTVSSNKLTFFESGLNFRIVMIVGLKFGVTPTETRSLSLSKGGEVVDKVDEPLEEEKKEVNEKSEELTKEVDELLDEQKEELTKEPLEPISEPLETKTDSLSKEETELKEEDESKEIEEITDVPEEEPEEEPTEEPVDPEPSKEEEADER